MPRPFGDQAHTGARERVGRHAGDVAAAEEHAARARHDLARRDRERRRLARAVRSEQREDLAGHAGRDRCRAARRCGRSRRGPPRAGAPARRPSRRVRARLDERGHDADFAVPRYARCTDGSAWISAGVPSRDDATEVEHADVRARLHHERHVVLDEQHAEPVGGELVQQHAERVGLLLVEPRRRFVEQQHLRLGRERTGELDEAGAPGGQCLDARVGDRRLIPTRSSSSSATAPQSYARRRPAAAHLERDEHVLARGEAAERLEPLERAGDAEPGAAVRALAGDVGAVETDTTARSAPAGR